MIERVTDSPILMPIAFGKEAIEKARQSSGIDARTTILNRAVYRFGIGLRSLYQDAPPSGVSHGLHGIDDQVHDQLLKLRSIAENYGKGPR